MTFKSRGANNNLFTLHSESPLEENAKSDQSSILQDASKIDFVNDDEQEYKSQNQQLLQQIQKYKKAIHAIKIKNKELKDRFQISQLHNKRHQEKQRQLIKKLSHEVIKTQQLQYMLKKSHDEIIKRKQNSKTSQIKNEQIAINIKKIQQKRILFIQSLKKIAEVISKLKQQEQFQSSLSKFVDFIVKNTLIYESSSLQQQFQFDLHFQLDKVVAIKNRNNELQVVVQKIRDQLQAEKGEKKRLTLNFNQKIMKLKQQSDQLRQRLGVLSKNMNQRQSQFSKQVNMLKRAIFSKNEIISELKQKLSEQIKQKDSMCSRKSRQRKRSFYIGDGQKQHGKPLSQIQNQIQDLQRQLIQVIEQFKQ